MGLISWKNSPDGKIMKYDISITKNYLNKSEIKKLESLTILFLDYKANSEYEKFRVKQDQAYISSMDELYKKYLEENKN